MSELPKIETFEGDITNEIRTKEANIRDIAVSNGAIENKEENKTANKNLIMISVSVVLILISTLSVTLYFMSQEKEVAQPPKVTQKNPSGFREKDLSSKLLFLYSKVGNAISKGEETPYGYILELANYNEVFAFTLKNETAFSKELADLLKVNIESSTTTPWPTFNDVTISNQNMRVLTSTSSDIVYSFLNGKYLLISTSTEGILSMRSAIIK